MASLDSSKKRAVAERLYINEGMTAKAIADQLDVSEKTIGTWKKGRKGEKTWDERRAEVLSAPHKIKELILQEMVKLSEGQKSTIDADAMIKLANSIDKLDKKLSVPVVISVFKEFDNWMSDQDPKAAIEFLMWHKAFVHYKAGE